MKNLLSLLLLCNTLLFCSEHTRKYTKNSCYRTYWDRHLTTEAERKECSECSLSRFEVYDEKAEKHIAYNAPRCHILYLLVDSEYERKGIGTELAKRAIEDMRTHHRCTEISLISAQSAKKFW